MESLRSVRSLANFLRAIDPELADADALAEILRVYDEIANLSPEAQLAPLRDREELAKLARDLAGQALLALRGHVAADHK